MRKDLEKYAWAYRVKCQGRGGEVEFYISLKSLKNNEKICAHCPERGRCVANKNRRVHFFSSIQANPKVKLPMEITILRDR